METLFSEDRGDPCDRNDPCVWIVRDGLEFYLGRSIRNDRFTHGSPLSSEKSVSVASKNLKRERRSLQQKRLYGNRPKGMLIPSNAHAFYAMLNVLYVKQYLSHFSKRSARALTSYKDEQVSNNYVNF